MLGSHEVKLAIKGQLTATKKTARTQGQRKCAEDFPKMHTHTTKKGKRSRRSWKNYVKTFKTKSCGRKWLAT